MLELYRNGICSFSTSPSVASFSRLAKALKRRCICTLGSQKLDLVSAPGSSLNCCTTLGKSRGVRHPVALITKYPLGVFLRGIFLLLDDPDEGLVLFKSQG